MQGVAITPANVTDAQGMKYVCPESGAIYGDKDYCTSPAIQTTQKKICHLAAIKKNNMKGKNKDKDRRFYSVIMRYFVKYSVHDLQQTENITIVFCPRLLRSYKNFMYENTESGCSLSDCDTLVKYL